MGKKSPSVPTPPDPIATAQAQAQANKEALTESARLNAVNLYGPTGSVTYDLRRDGTPRSQITQLTPEGQWAYDAQQAIAAQLATQANARIGQIPTDAFSLSGLPYSPAGYDTSGYQVFSPVSYPRDLTQADTSFAQPNGNAGASFFSPQAQAAVAALGGKGGAQGMPPAASPSVSVTGANAPSQDYVPSQTTYQPSTPGTSVRTDNQWFPNATFNTSTGASGPPPTNVSRMPTFPGAGASTSQPPTTQPPPATPQNSGDWSYGQSIPAGIMSRKTPAGYVKKAANPLSGNPAYGDKQSVTGYGLSLYKKFGQDPAKFSQAAKGDLELSRIASAYNIKSPQDLLYVQRMQLDPERRLGYAGPKFKFGDTVDDKFALLNYRMNTLGRSSAPAASPAAPQQQAAQMPAFPGTAASQPPAGGPGPTTVAGPPQGAASPFGGQQAQGGIPPISKGNTHGALPPLPVSGGLITSQPQTTGTAAPTPPSPPGNSGAIPSAYPTANLDVLPYDPRSYGNVDAYVNGTQDAVFDQQMRNLRPVIDQQYDRQFQMLQDRGLPVGGEAWNKAISQLNRDVGNQYQQATNQAVAAGAAEAERRLGMEQGLRSTAWGEALGGHQQANSDIQQRLQIEQNLRNQALQEYLMGRTQNFNEASAFLQGSPALQMPQAPLVPTYKMDAPDVIGATMGAYSAAMQGYNARAAQAGSAWQGGAQILGALPGMKSSSAYKHDEKPVNSILDAVNSLRIHAWRYMPQYDPRQEVHIGPYAEDWKRELGLGDGKEIAVVDACGVLLKCVQELSGEIAKLKNAKPTKRRASSRRARKTSSKRRKAS